MSYLEDKLRNGRLTKQEHDELLVLINAALDAANEFTKALHSPSFDGSLEAAEDADDRAYRAVLVWLGAYTLPETSTTAGGPDAGPGTGSEVSS